MNTLDKFYTKPNIAEQCFCFLQKHYPSISQEYFLEPSAGSGNFLLFLKQYEAFDIKPEGKKCVDTISATKLRIYFETRKRLRTFFAVFILKMMKKCVTLHPENKK